MRHLLILNLLRSHLIIDHENATYLIDVRRVAYVPGRESHLTFQSKEKDTAGICFRLVFLPAPATFLIFIFYFLHFIQSRPENQADARGVLRLL